MAEEEEVPATQEEPRRPALDPKGEEEGWSSVRVLAVYMCLSLVCCTY